MQPRRIVLGLPLGVLSALRKTPEEFSGEVRLAAAAKWYEMGLLSQEKAAQAAGMCREDFLLALSRFGVPPFPVFPPGDPGGGRFQFVTGCSTLLL